MDQQRINGGPRPPSRQPDRRADRRQPVPNERRTGPTDMRRQPRVPAIPQPFYHD